MVTPNSSTAPQFHYDRSELVLLLMPTGRDSIVTSACLHEAGIGTQACTTLEDFCAAIYTTAMGLIAIEALSHKALIFLIDALQHQPIWSDFPLLLLTRHLSSSQTIWQLVQRLAAIGNVTLLERPLNRVALLSSVHVALRARRRQYGIRYLYEELQQRIIAQTTTLGMLRDSESRLQLLNETLETRISDRTTALEQQTQRLQQEMAERQRMQEAMFQQEKLAALGTLLANIAHELNNPLAVATMQVNNLYEESDTRTEDLDTLRQALERCNSVVQSFLALARQQPPTRNNVALNAVIGDVLVLLRHALEVDGIALHFAMADDLPFLWADAHQLHHVVSNLITNAHHALRQTTPEARHLTFMTRANMERTQITLEVIDTGPGIPEDLQRRIFEPFFTTKTQETGSGLGLPLCRNIVEGHGGSIAIFSQPEHGTRVSITLPAAPTGFQLPVTAEKAAEQIHPTQHHGTILLIDDEPGMQQALQRLLRRSGHVIVTAANGYEGLAALEKQTFDIILCDMRMPVLDGPGFYRELERRSPHLLSRIVFLTGDVLSQGSETFFTRVGCPHLSKPFKISEVRQVIQQILAAQ